MRAVCYGCGKEVARSVNWDHSSLLLFSSWAHRSRQLCCWPSLHILGLFGGEEVSRNRCEKEREEVLKCQLSVDSFVVCLFIFKRERERENT